MKIATPLKKATPPLSQQPTSKSWGPVKPPFLRIWLEAQPPLPCRKRGGGGGGGGVHTMFNHLLMIWYHDTTHRIPPISILCIFIGPIQLVRHLGKGREKETKSDIERRACSQKKWCPSHKFSYIHFSVTDNLTANNKKSTSKKDATIVSEITIQYLHKNIIILLLCQCGLNFLKFQLKWKIVKYFARLKQRAALRKLFSLSPSHSH